MRNADRTTKILLGVIALLLAAIAFQPLWEGRKEASAEIGTITSHSTTPATSPATSPGATIATSLRAALVTGINFRDPVLAVQVMDSQHVFLVQTKNRVEVYRVDNLP